MTGTQKIFLGIALAIGIGFIILWYRWNECRKKNGIQPKCTIEPCPFIFGNCSFWTGKLIVDAPPLPDNNMPDVKPKDVPKTIIAGKVDLWCNNGKYYKRTTTTIYGKPDLLELTKSEFDVLKQTISYTGCPV